MELLLNTIGIRILDVENHLVSVYLKDILEEIDGANYFWSILFFDGMGLLKNWNSLDDFENNVNKSEKGLFINWKDLNDLANQFDEIIDILIIGSKNQKVLVRYDDSEEMYKSCDFVINKFDSSYWEVFSNDQRFIQKFSEKFKKIKWLKPDFLKSS